MDRCTGGPDKTSSKLNCVSANKQIIRRKDIFDEVKKCTGGNGNKAGYTAIQSQSLAGAVIRKPHGINKAVYTPPQSRTGGQERFSKKYTDVLFGSGRNAEIARKSKMLRTDRPTDRPTDRQTDRHGKF